MALDHKGNVQPTIDKEEHWHLDGDESKAGVKRVAAFIYAMAIDGPSIGLPVAINAQYNYTTSQYELLTAGSGGSTAPTEGIGAWVIGTDFTIT